ncbi:unnamed protein product [Bursaphelenchus xylophilus]|uniref:(pine wood nematode) hypothetical protein n=1 Tax=Bursaphelenchus xylophilus TaxID=6326 RepID=A0A1I7SRZ1_BURXY|nr:unnamed protein product [Bursaphelenchus xylophilus]CAG9101690.1 unnamed protein product [Bursaphelenchus xylophilus]
MSESLDRAYSTPKTTKPRLNTTVPQFSPATPHKEPVPFGAPLNRAQISEPLACSTRRLEYLKAKSFFESKAENNNQQSEPNLDTISDFYPSESCETPLSRDPNSKKAKRRDYGKELEDRVRGMFMRPEFEPPSPQKNYTQTSTSNSTTPQRHLSMKPYGDQVVEEVSVHTAKSLEYNRSCAVSPKIYRAPSSVVRAEETVDEPTITQEDLRNAHQASVCDDNASYYTEVSSIVPAEMDHTNAAIRTNNEICKEILDRIEHLKTTIHLNCDLLGFYRTRLVGNGSAEELQANRDLLVNLEEYAALKRELRRLDDYIELKVLHPMGRRHISYNMDLLSMRLKLNRNYYMKTVDGSTTYAFVALIKCGTIVKYTKPTVVHEHRSVRLATLIFNDPIRLDNLPIDFRAHIEIYQMKLEDRPDPPSDCLFACGSKKMEKMEREMHQRQLSIHPNWLESEFIRCGWLVVTSEMAGKRRFLMHDVEYPLEGTIELKINCSELPGVMEDALSGYLRVHQTRHNRKPEWVTFFVELYRGVLNFYRTETDIYNHRRPFAVLSISDICSREVSEARDKWTDGTFVFYFDYVSTSGNDKTISRRILLASETEDMCTEWRSRLNAIIKLVNGYR